MNRKLPADEKLAGSFFILGEKYYLCENQYFMNMALTLKTWNKKRVLTSLPDFWFLALLLAGWIDLGRSVFSGEWHMMIILVVLFLSVLTAIFVKQILNRKAALSIIIGVILLLVSFYLLLALFAEFAEFQSAGEPRAVELMLGGVTVVGGSLIMYILMMIRGRFK